MVEAARERGYEYLAVTDHSASHGFGNHVTPEALEAPDRARCAALNHTLDGFQRAGRDRDPTSCPDGSLDYPDELLGELDWVIASVHTSFDMAEEAMTDRVLGAPWSTRRSTRSAARPAASSAPPCRTRST